jgi:FeS assembly SUF system regulator
MLKVSKLADYAVVVLATLSKGDSSLMTAIGISGKTGLPEPTVAKVLKSLAKAEIVQSVRGVNGGYKPLYKPSELSVARIVTAVDGPISVTACVDDKPDSCAHQSKCLMRGRWNNVNYAIRAAMEGVTLADMMSPSFPRESGDLKTSAFAEETTGGTP